MTKGQRTVATLLAAIVLLPLTGCFYTWHAYPGPKLPNNQTALLLGSWGVDGEGPPFFMDGWGILMGIRIEPGTHYVEGMNPPMRATFNAEAGETYTVHWPWKKGVRHIWIEDKSGSVVAGEKPPEK